MTGDITFRKILQVAFPIILSSIAQNILNVTDTAFLSRVGEVALGAGMLGGLFYQVLIMLGWGLALGGQIIIARRYGEGHFRLIGRVHLHLVYSLAAVAVVITLIVYQAKGFLLSLAVSSLPVQNACAGYVAFRMWGLILAFLTFSFNSFYVGIAKTKVLTLSTVIMVVVNIVLDYLLIFGQFGFPKMGVAGAALASSIAELVTLLFLIRFTFRYVDFRSYRLFRFAKPEFDLFSRLFKVGSPLMLQFFLSIFAWLVFFLFIEKMGERPLAASNIIRSIYIVLMVPVWGFASATNTFVSQLIGRGEPGRVMSALRKVLLLSVMSVALLAVVAVLFPDFLIGIYTDDQSLLAIARPVIGVIAAGAVTLSAAFVFFNAVSGTGNTTVSLFIELVTLSVYLGYAYTNAVMLQQPLSMVWTSEIVYGVGVSLVSLGYLLSKRWVGKTV